MSGWRMFGKSYRSPVTLRAIILGWLIVDLTVLSFTYDRFGNELKALVRAEGACLHSAPALQAHSASAAGFGADLDRCLPPGLVSYSALT